MKKRRADMGNDVTYDGTNLKVFMLHTRGELDWDKRAQEVKDFHNGSYPKEWYETCISSGMLGCLKIEQGW